LAHTWPEAARSTPPKDLTKLFRRIDLGWSHPPGLNRRPTDYEWILGGTRGNLAGLSACFSLSDSAFNHAESLHDRHTRRHTLTAPERYRRENPLVAKTLALDSS